jgi:Tetracyclin repressor-like, C-terminal domain
MWPRRWPTSPPSGGPRCAHCWNPARREGAISADANLDTVTDLAYGFLWYRLLVGRAPLDEAAARDLAAHLLAAGNHPLERA